MRESLLAPECKTGMCDNYIHNNSYNCAEKSRRDFGHSLESRLCSSPRRDGWTSEWQSMSDIKFIILFNSCSTPGCRKCHLITTWTGPHHTYSFICHSHFFEKKKKKVLTYFVSHKCCRRTLSAVFYEKVLLSRAELFNCCVANIMSRVTCTL